jgi:hypothetical protein
LILNRESSPDPSPAGYSIVTSVNNARIKMIQTNLGALYLYWPTYSCRLHKLHEHFSKSQIPFFKENAQILEFEVDSWQQRAKDFILEIWAEIDEPEMDLGDIIIEDNDNDSDVDPNLIRKSQSGSSIGGIEGILFNFFLSHCFFKTS